MLRSIWPFFVADALCLLVAEGGVIPDYGALFSDVVLGPLRHPGLRASLLWALLVGNFGFGSSGSRVKPGMTVLWLAVMAVGPEQLCHPGLRAGVQSHRTGVLLGG